MELFTLVASLLSPLNLYETITLGIGLCLVRLLSGKDWKMRRDPIYTLCLEWNDNGTIPNLSTEYATNGRQRPPHIKYLSNKTYLIYYSRL